MGQASKRSRRRNKMFRAFNLTTICQNKGCKKKIKFSSVHHKYCKACWLKIKKSRDKHGTFNSYSDI